MVGVKRLKTKGRLDMAEVPSIAFVITEMPNALMNAEQIKRKYLLNSSCRDIFTYSLEKMIGEK